LLPYEGVHHPNFSWDNSLRIYKKQCTRPATKSSQFQHSSRNEKTHNAIWGRVHRISNFLYFVGEQNVCIAIMSAAFGFTWDDRLCSMQVHENLEILCQNLHFVLGYWTTIQQIVVIVPPVASSIAVSVYI